MTEHKLCPFCGCEGEYATAVIPVAGDPYNEELIAFIKCSKCGSRSKEVTMAYYDYAYDTCEYAHETSATKQKVWEAWDERV